MNFESWRAVKLEELADEITVGFVGSMTSEYVTSGIPFLRSQNVEPLRVNSKDLKYITEAFHQRIRKSRLTPGDVVIVRTGKPGACSVIPESLHEANCSDLVIVRCGKRLDNRFLAYYVNTVASHHVSAHLVGAVQQHFNVGSARELQIDLPPLSEQKAIVHILSSLDDKIELNRKMNETLEAMARALFKSWFIDFDPVRAKADGRKPAGMDDATAALFPSCFSESNFGYTPEGWLQTNLGLEVEFLAGFTFKSEYFLEYPPGIKLARGDNVKEGFFHWDTKARYWPEITPDLEKYQLQVGDVLIGMDGSKVGKNWVRVRRCDLPCLLVQRVARLRQSNSIGQHFIWLLISDPRFCFYVESVKTGTSIPHISGGQIKAYDFIRPGQGDNRLFDAFDRLVAPLCERMDSNIEEIGTLSSIRDALLPKLLSGEIRIKDAERFVEANLS